jgi:hypothetical protein
MQVLENITQFANSHFSQNGRFIQSQSCFVTQQYSLHYLQQSLSSFLSELLEFGLSTTFLKLFFLCLAFSFFSWMTGELLGTLHGDFPLPLMALRLTILVGVFA